MYFSRYNLISRIKNSENFFIINPLTRNADILSPERAQNIMEKRYNDEEELINKGYLIDEDKEKLLYRTGYLDFVKQRDNSEIQIFFVPHYACNFSCSYCYQDRYSLTQSPLTEEVMGAFFDYVGREFAGKKKYVTIFGGEPLLPGEQQKKLMGRFLELANKNALDVAVVTNGFHLADYIDILKKARIREIQVTLDGTKEVHDTRRVLSGGGGTFDRIVTGIDRALESGFPVNLRVVVDRDNIDNLPDLASFAIDRGWTADPLFKTQLGRNYELHHCQPGASRLFDRTELYEKIYEMIFRHPHIVEFHRPAYSITRFLYDNGEMPDPLFDSCPGCKTEWAFDYTGAMYPCTANVGKKGEEVGTFYPEVTRRKDITEEWEDRDVTTIQECGACSLQLLCGGGCAAVAKNRTGTITAPDCRPVDKLLEMGISLFYEKGVMSCLKK